MDKFTVDCMSAPGWENFYKHCCNLYYNSDAVSMNQVYDHQLAEQFGYEYPRVRVKSPRTYPAYFRFRCEDEYTAFILRWA